MVISTPVTIRYVRRIQQPEVLDRMLLLWSTVEIAGVFVMNGLRPPAYGLQLGDQALALLAVYLVIPNTLSARLVVATFVIAVARLMHLSGRRDADASDVLQVWSTTVLANLMGVASSSRFDTSSTWGATASSPLESAG